MAIKREVLNVLRTSKSSFSVSDLESPFGEILKGTKRARKTWKEEEKLASDLYNLTFAFYTDGTSC
jgi:hypothetical protein